MTRFGRWNQRLQRIGRDVSRQFIEAVYPASCAGCGIPGEWFCLQCSAEIQVDHRPGCSRCGRRGARQNGCSRCDEIFPPALLQLRAGFLFREPLRTAIHQFKYQGQYQRGYDLASRLAGRLPVILSGASQLEAVVPVPLHSRRYRQRGFNQATVLAEVVAREIDAPLVHAIRRVRNTPSQTSLDPMARAANVDGAFEPDANEARRITGRRVMVIDDVTTTGATMAAVAKSLESAGALSIVGVALAREG